MGLAGHVVLTAPRPLHAAHELLAAGDVTVAPRPRLPGFPIKLLNYMAARKASVLFASTGAGWSTGKPFSSPSPIRGMPWEKRSRRFFATAACASGSAREGYHFARANFDSGRMAARLGDTYSHAATDAASWSDALGTEARGPPSGPATP